MRQRKSLASILKYKMQYLDDKPNEKAVKKKK
jgi:hypothetical protein